jgi:hypothetical protein
MRKTAAMPRTEEMTLRLVETDQRRVLATLNLPSSPGH